MQIFKEKSQKVFKSRFDTAIAKYSSRAAGIFRNFGKRFDLRRVMVILLQQKNFSANVIYFGRHLAVYSRGALQREGGRGGGRRSEEGREKSRNLTTPHRRGGEKDNMQK